MTAILEESFFGEMERAEHVADRTCLGEQIRKNDGRHEAGCFPNMSKCASFWSDVAGKHVQI